jgi:hypothetical protein
MLRFCQFKYRIIEYIYIYIILGIDDDGAQIIKLGREPPLNIPTLYMIYIYMC